MGIRRRLPSYEARIEFRGHSEGARRESKIGGGTSIDGGNILPTFKPRMTRFFTGRSLLADCVHDRGSVLPHSR